MKSVILFAIGAILIGVAVSMNNAGSEKEASQRDFLNSVQAQHVRVDRVDRMPMYLLGGLGGICIVAGIMTLGTGKKSAENE